MALGKFADDAQYRTTNFSITRRRNDNGNFQNLYVETLSFISEDKKCITQETAIKVMEKGGLIWEGTFADLMLILSREAVKNKIKGGQNEH